MGYRIHPLADVQSQHIGDGTRVWQFTVILKEAQVGKNCNICSHVFIENDVRIGDRVTVKNGARLFDGVSIGDDVFIGPNVCFTNDRRPKSLQGQDRTSFTPLPTIVESGVSIGAGAVLLPGIVIGAGAMIAAGATVTKSVSSGAVVGGVPARPLG